MNERQIEIRMEALRAAAKVAAPGIGVGSLLANAQWLAQFIETGKGPEIEVQAETSCSRLNLERRANPDQN